MQKTLSARQLEILNATVKLIGEGGIQGLTIKNLSHEIGITESAIYRHFSSRTEILEVLLDTIKENITAKYTRAAQSGKDSFDRIRAMLDYQFSTFTAHPSYAIVILSDGLYQNEPVLRDRIYDIMEFARETFIKIINEGKEAGQIRKDISSGQLAFIIMGSIRLMINQWTLSEFRFDLKRQGSELRKTLELLLKNENH